MIFWRVHILSMPNLLRKLSSISYVADFGKPCTSYASCCFVGVSFKLLYDDFRIGSIFISVSLKMKLDLELESSYMITVKDSSKNERLIFNISCQIDTILLLIKPSASGLTKFRCNCLENARRNKI